MAEEGAKPKGTDEEVLGQHARDDASYAFMPQLSMDTASHTLVTQVHT